MFKRGQKLKIKEDYDTNNGFIKGAIVFCMRNQKDGEDDIRVTKKLNKKGTPILGAYGSDSLWIEESYLADVPKQIVFITEE